MNARSALVFVLIIRGKSNHLFQVDIMKHCPGIHKWPKKRKGRGVEQMGEKGGVEWTGGKGGSRQGEGRGMRGDGGEEGRMNYTPLSKSDSTPNPTHPSSFFTNQMNLHCT